MKKVSVVALVVLIFGLSISYINEQVVTDQQSIETSQDYYNIYENDELRIAIENTLILLDESVFATYKGEKLRVESDDEINQYRDVINRVSTHIFYLDALKLDIKPNKERIRKQLAKAQSDEIVKAHKEKMEQLEMNEEEYWRDMERELKKSSIVMKYLYKKIGDPAELGGAEFKKRMNKWIEETFIMNQKDIQINKRFFTN